MLWNYQRLLCTYFSWIFRYAIVLSEVASALISQSRETYWEVTWIGLRIHHNFLIWPLLIFSVLWRQENAHLDEILQQLRVIVKTRVYFKAKSKYCYTMVLKSSNIVMILLYLSIGFLQQLKGTIFSVMEWP